MAKKFSIPKLKSYPIETGKDWYVWFRYQGGNPIRISEGINKIKDYDERVKAGNVLAEVLHDKLKNGWKPNTRQKSLPTPTEYSYTIEEAYKLAYEKLMDSDRRPKTKSRYKTHYNYFIKAVKDLKFNKFPLGDFEPYHINLILEKIGKRKPKSNVFFNTHLNGSSAFFSVLAKDFIIKNNPVSFIKEKKHTPAERRLLTDEEYIQIFTHFEKISPNFVTYLMCQELGVRPEEIRGIKCGMIKNGYFELPAEITKNRKDGIVPIPDYLMERIEKMDISNPDNYLFGIELVRSRDINKKFKPSPFPLSKNVGNNLWRKEVKDKFGIDSDMYALKSRKANTLRKKGIDLAIIRDQFRHSNETITKIYATEHQKIRMEEVKKAINETSKKNDIRK